MKISSAMVADYASQREGLLFVIGGGVRNLYPAGLPVNVPLSVALLVEAAPSEVDKSGQVEFDVRVTLRPKGRKPIGGMIAKVVSSLKEPGSEAPLLFPVTVDLRPFVITREGVHTLTIEVGKKSLRLGFDVAVRPTPELPESLSSLLS